MHGFGDIPSQPAGPDSRPKPRGPHPTPRHRAPEEAERGRGGAARRSSL